MMPGSGCRKCRIGLRPGPGGMPLALRLSEGFGFILVRKMGLSLGVDAFSQAYGNLGMPPLAAAAAAGTLVCTP